MGCDVAHGKPNHGQAVGCLDHAHIVDSDTVVMRAGAADAAAVDGEAQGLAVVAADRGYEGGVGVRRYTPASWRK